MKIRTDFVTNSSSSNYVTICIKNPKLVEIIRAARKSGKIEGWGDDEDFPSENLEIDESEHSVKLELGISDIIGYYPDTPEDKIRIGYPPENLNSLSQCLPKLLKEASEYQIPNYDLAKICSALEQNSETIIAGTESADWTYHSEGYGEANLEDWFWALSRHIAEKEHLDYRPSSVGFRSSFHYDKENGASLEEEYSYDKPHQKNITEEDLEDEIDFIASRYDEDDGNPDVPIFEDNEDDDLIPVEEDDLNWQGYDDDFTEEDE